LGRFLPASSGYTHCDISNEEEAMAKLINCPCGATIRGETDDELVANAEEHVRTAHPEQEGQRTREDFLAMAEEAGA
jgi:predicted small metal-binding protein